MKRVLAYMFIVFTASSCYSYRTNFKGHEMKGQFESLPKQTVFVTNKNQFKKEYRILRKSQIYALTNDSSCANKIELAEGLSRPYFGCAMYMIGFVFTIGQIPVVRPEAYSFRYKEIKGKNISNTDLVLSFEKRLWFWDMFSTRKNLSNVVAKELRYNKVKSQKQEAVTSIQINQKSTHEQ